MPSRTRRVVVVTYTTKPRKPRQWVEGRRPLPSQMRAVSALPSEGECRGSLVRVSLAPCVLFPPALRAAMMFLPWLRCERCDCPKNERKSIFCLLARAQEQGLLTSNRKHDAVASEQNAKTNANRPGGAGYLTNNNWHSSRLHLQSS